MLCVLYVRCVCGLCHHAVLVNELQMAQEMCVCLVHGVWCVFACVCVCVCGCNVHVWCVCMCVWCTVCILHGRVWVCV